MVVTQTPKNLYLICGTVTSGNSDILIYIDLWAFYNKCPSTIYISENQSNDLHTYQYVASSGGLCTKI